MKIATLEAALPALTVELLTGVDAASQVLVTDAEEGVRRSDLHVVWTFLEEVAVQDAGGLGRRMHALRYQCVIRDGSATQAERRAWAQELRAGLDHRRRPLSVPGIDHAQVLGIKVAPTDGVSVPASTGAAVAEADVLFVGDVLPSDDALGSAPDELGLGANLALWLDAQDEGTLTLVGTKVSVWADKSPAARSLVQGTDANRPTFGATEMNGVRPGVTFARASSQQLTCAWTTLGQTGEVYAVVVPDAMASGERALCAWDGAGNSRIILYHAINNGAGKSLGFDVHDGAAARSVRGATLITASEPQVWAWRTNGSAYALGLDGVDEALTVVSGSNDGAWWTDLASLTTFLLGVRHDGVGDFFGGTLGELVVVNWTLTAAQRTALLAYFSERWGRP